MSDSQTLSKVIKNKVKEKSAENSVFPVLYIVSSKMGKHPTKLIQLHDTKTLSGVSGVYIKKVLYKI